MKWIRRAKTLALCVVLLAVIGYGAYNWYYPFGRRCCLQKLLFLALYNYAGDHDGALPAGLEPGRCSLELLYPEYADAYLLTGMNGDQRKVEEALKSGKSIAGSTSWIYRPGLKLGSGFSSTSVVAYEKRSRFRLDGSRSSEKSRIVICLDGFTKMIPEDIEPPTQLP